MSILIKNRKKSRGFLTLVFNPTYLPHATLTLSRFTLTVYTSINFLRPAQIHCSSRFLSLLHATQHKLHLWFPSLFTSVRSWVVGCSSVLTTQYSVLSAHKSSNDPTSYHSLRFCWFLYRCRRLDSWTDLFLCLRDRFKFYCLFLNYLSIPYFIL